MLLAMLLTYGFASKTGKISDKRLLTLIAGISIIISFFSSFPFMYPLFFFPPLPLSFPFYTIKAHLISIPEAIPLTTYFLCFMLFNTACYQFPLEMGVQYFISMLYLFLFYIAVNLMGSAIGLCIAKLKVKK